MQLHDRDIYREFERAGEERVRDQRALGRYDERRARLAGVWLAKMEQARHAIAAAEQLELTRRATLAAESSADTAKAANRHALVANAIAVFAAAAAFVAILVSLND